MFMKRFLCSCFLCCLIGITYGQKTRTLYLDGELNKSNKKHASYIRTMEEKGDHYVVEDRNLNGILLVHGEYTKSPLLEDGLFMYYDSLGRIRSRGYYSNGKLKGSWMVYLNSTHDSLLLDYDKVEKYLQSSTNLTDNSLTDSLNSHTADLALIIQCQTFMQNHYITPMRIIRFPKNYDMKASFTLGKDGKIHNPRVWYSRNTDEQYEVLRNLLSFTNFKKVKTPIKVIFYVFIDNQVYDQVDVPARYKGVDGMFFSDVNNNLDYPLDTKPNTNGVIQVSAVVTKQGKCDQVKVLQGMNSEMDQAVVKAVMEAPSNWIPAKYHGRLVNQRISFPVKITLGEDKNPIDYSEVDTYFKSRRDSCIACRMFTKYQKSKIVDTLAIMNNIQDYMATNYQENFKINYLPRDYKMKMSFTLDTKGKLLCPEISNCNNKKC